MAASPMDSASPLAVASSTKATPSLALPPDPSQSFPLPTIQFTSFGKLVAAIDATDGDVLIVHGVSAKDFEDIDEARSKAGRGFRFRYFSARSRILIVTITTGPHEQLHRWIDTRVDRSFDRMGLGDNWLSIGSERFEDRPSKSSAEGDSTAGPDPARADAGAWPTLVIEAGFSQSLAALRNRMKWWFNASNHQVKIVLLAKFDQNQDDQEQNKIILEKWVEVQAPPRQGATTTRAAAQSILRLIPDCSQVISISRNSGITDTHPARFHPASYTVTSGVLRLEFGRLFLRQPGQGEGDIVLSIQDLQTYAAKVWQKWRVQEKAVKRDQ